jgi:hypothetical protein
LAAGAFTGVAVALVATLVAFAAGLLAADFAVVGFVAGLTVGLAADDFAVAFTALFVAPLASAAFDLLAGITVTS